METITNPSFHFNEAPDMTRGVSFSHSDDAIDAGLTVLGNSKQRSHSCLSITNNCSLSNCPDVIMNGCETKPVVITSNVDPEIQEAAQMFVEKLLFKAREEVSCKVSAQHQVNYIENIVVVRASM